MALYDTDVIDGIATNKDRKALLLLLTDHFPWSENDTLSEYEHLMLLQKKINAYISYLETKQYEELYPEEEIKMAVIELHFKYSISENCKNFIKTVQSQIDQYGINIEVHIG